MKVYVLTVDNVDESNIAHLSVHTSEVKAREFLAAYCRGEWESQGHEGHLKNDLGAIDRYFSYWNEEMGWDISEREVDPDPATVEQSKEFAAGQAENEFSDDE